MPFAWTAVHLMHIINGASSLDRNSDGDLGKLVVSEQNVFLGILPRFPPTFNLINDCVLFYIQKIQYFTFFLNFPQKINPNFPQNKIWHQSLWESSRCPVRSPVGWSHIAICLGSAVWIETKNNNIFRGIFNQDFFSFLFAGCLSVDNHFCVVWELVSKTNELTDFLLFIFPEKRTSSLELGRKGSSKESSTYGSLPRKNLEMSGSGTLKRNGSERRSFYRTEEDMSHLQTFHPVTITVSSFFKQVG